MMSPSLTELAGGVPVVVGVTAVAILPVSGRAAEPVQWANEPMTVVPTPAWPRFMKRIVRKLPDVAAVGVALGMIEPVNVPVTGARKTGSIEAAAPPT